MSNAGQARRGSGAPHPDRKGDGRRRLTDAARLVPLLGVLLFSLPLLWSVPGSEQARGEAVPMSNAITYVFVSWAGLIAIVALLGFCMRRRGAPEAPRGPGLGAWRR